MKNIEVETYQRIKNRQDEIFNQSEDSFLDLIDICNTLIRHNPYKLRYIFFISGHFFRLRISTSVVDIYQGLIFGKRLLKIERNLVMNISPSDKEPHYKWGIDIRDNSYFFNIMKVIDGIIKGLQYKLKKINEKLLVSLDKFETSRKS